MPKPEVTHAGPRIQETSGTNKHYEQGQHRHHGAKCLCGLPLGGANGAVGAQISSNQPAEQLQGCLLRK